MSIQGKSIVIIGAGIAGLAVARALALRGAQVQVLEQAPEIKEVGAGLQISPNGYVVLKALGLDQALQDISVQAQAVNFHDYRGGRVARLDLARLENRNYHFLHRADLIDLLAQGARDAGVRLRLLHKVQKVEPGERMILHTVHGAKLSADLVIGADGLNSQLRPILNGPETPFFTGQVAWRAVVPNTAPLSPEVRLFMGPHRHLVCYPLRGGKFINIVAVQERSDWIAQSWSHEDNPDNLRAAFADFGPEVRALLANVAVVHLWGLFRHQVAQNWQKDGLFLLGDAAHPTLPFLAQGASMALEDAWALADVLGSGADPVTYQTRRRDRAVRIVNASGRNAWKYHLAFPPLRFAAHTGLRVMSALAPGRLVNQFDWLYNYDITKT